MGMKTRGRPPKPVIAIPTNPVKKAGGRELSFPSVKAAAEYFGIAIPSLVRTLKRDNCNLPSCGYYFDYELVID